jgi:hypothetical protein
VSPIANPYHHAVSSARRFGGVPEDYIEIHSWFDRSKRSFADFRHRALYHHTEGIFDCEEHFGKTISLSICAKCGKPEGEYDKESPHAFTPKQIPTRWIGEQHVQEDLGFIPTAAQWLERIAAEPWMNRSRKLSRELERSRSST